MLNSPAGWISSANLPSQRTAHHLDILLFADWGLVISNTFCQANEVLGGTYQMGGKSCRCSPEACPQLFLFLKDLSISGASAELHLPSTLPVAQHYCSLLLLLWAEGLMTCSSLDPNLSPRKTGWWFSWQLGGGDFPTTASPLASPKHCWYSLRATYLWQLLIFPMLFPNASLDFSLLKTKLKTTVVPFCQTTTRHCLTLLAVLLSLKLKLLRTLILVSFWRAVESRNKSLIFFSWPGDV